MAISSSSTSYWGLVHDSAYGSEKSTALAATFPRVAVNRNTTAISYRNGSAVGWLLLDSSLTKTAGPTQLASAGSNAVVVTSSSGFALAWATASGFTLQLRSTSGSSVCSNDVMFGNGTLDANYDAVDLVQTQYGVLVLASDTGGSIALFRFDASGNLLDGPLDLSPK